MWNSTRPEGEECPSSNRIIHEIHQVVYIVYPDLYKASSVAFYHYAQNVCERRESLTESGSSIRGGKREKTEDCDLSDVWIHESVMHCWKVLLKEREETKQFENSLKIEI